MWEAWVPSPVLKNTSCGQPSQSRCLTGRRSCLGARGYQNSWGHKRTPFFTNLHLVLGSLPGSSLCSLEHSNTFFKTSLSCHCPASQCQPGYLMCWFLERRYLHLPQAQNVGSITSVSQRERWMVRRSHHHVSGFLPVTSLAAKVRPSVMTFGAMMVNTVPPVHVLSEKLSWEGNLTASWLCPGCYLRMSW